jgi:hypothetical protein
VFDQLAFLGVVLISITSLVLLVIKDWRVSITALAIQYLGVFELVGLSWPLELAAVKLVAGWMAGAVLGVALLGVTDKTHKNERIVFGSVLFRLLTASLVGLVSFSVAPQLEASIPGIRYEQVLGGIILIGMGLLQLGLTALPLRIVLGLLTVFSGFEILYAVVETSTLVSGLLAGVSLGLALVGAYLMTVPTLEDIG